MYLVSNRFADVSIGSFDAECLRRIASGDSRSIVYILPTGARARDLINIFSSEVRGKAIELPRILSLGEFVTKLRTSIAPEYRLISDSEQSALLEFCIRDLFKAGKLHYFEQRNDAPGRMPLFRGTFDELLVAINGFSEQGVDTQSLETYIEKNSESASALAKLRDVVTICEAYRTRLGETITDLYGQYALLESAFDLSNVQPNTDLLASSMQATFPGVREVYIAPFVKFAPPAFHLLRSLTDVPDLGVTFAVECERGNPELFASQIELLNTLTESGLKARAVTSSDVSVSSFRTHLARTLFARTVVEDPFDSTNMLREYAASSIDDEVRFVARKIKELISNNGGKRYDTIAVASSDQETYAPIVKTIFREYGIPFQLTHRLPLSGSPVFHAVEALLELGAFKLGHKRIAAVLSSPYLTIRHNGAELDAHRLLATLAEYSLPQRANEWHSEIEEIADELELEIENELGDEFERRKLERRRDDLLRAAEEIVAIETLADSLARPRTPGEFVRDLRKQLEEIFLVPNLLSSSGPLIAMDEYEPQSRAYTMLLQVLDEVAALSVKLGYGEQELELDFYLERIRAAASKARFASRAEPGSSVLVSSFDQIIGYEFDHVFLMGLREGLYPSAFRSPLFIPEAYSKTNDAHLESERFYFYQTLCTARTELTLSYYTGSEDGSRTYNKSSALAALGRSVRIAPATSSAGSFTSTEFFVRHANIDTWRSEEHLRSLMMKAIEAGLDATEAEHLSRIMPPRIDIEALRATTVSSKYSGDLAHGSLSDASKERLARYRDHVYSITQLETYASCGFKYFCKYVLGLSEKKDVSEEGLDAAEKGSTLHKALNDLLERYKEHNLNIRKRDDTDSEVGREIISSLADTKQVNRLHPFARLDREQIFVQDTDGKNAIKRFIDIEQSSDLKSITAQPRYFELVFGSESAPKREGYPDPATPVELGGIKLRGKIDRVDMSDDGSIVVVDYKTSYGSSRTDIEKGYSLQLPLYVRIAEDLLQAHVEGKKAQGVVGLYHTLKANAGGREVRFGLRSAYKNIIEDTKAGKKFESVEELEGFIDALIEKAKGYVEGIASGKFPFVSEKRRDKTCGYCEYSSVCRVAQIEADGLLVGE